MANTIYELLARCRKRGECLVFIGATNGPRGYGHVRIGDQDWLAHRLAWTLKMGPIPKGMHVCHRCDNPPCCNPDHLFLGTREENIKDMIEKGRSSFGEKRWSARLTAPEALAVYADPRTNGEIGLSYGISYKNVWAIKNGRAWYRTTGHARSRH